MTLRSPSSRLSSSLEAVRRLHRNGAGGVRVALALTARLDRLIQKTFDEMQTGSGRDVAIVALGGYGRKELCFASDVDIMFLYQDERAKRGATEVVQKMLHRLLDAGLDIGHSFRSIDECVTLRTHDLSSWISVLEWRFVAGNRKVSNELGNRLKIAVDEDDHEGFVEQLADALRQRHEKYGDSTKLLEPNIKNSAGGLRDLQTVLWMMVGTGLCPLMGTREGAYPAVTALFEIPLMRKLFQRMFLADTRRAFDFLLRTRNEMHAIAHSLHDSLDFAFQPSVAKGLGYEASRNRTAVEHFMQEYYQAVRNVETVTRRMNEWSRNRWIPSRPAASTATVGESFALQTNRLVYRLPGSKFDNVAVLQALLLRAERRLEFSYELEDLVLRLAPKLPPLKSDQEIELWHRLLALPEGVGDAIRLAAGFGVLQRWIPEWKAMVAFFQHNQYHFYTADEHTLKVLATAEALSQSTSSFGEAFRMVPRREALYLACLLHDIAKPLKIGDHEITGVTIGERVLRRLRHDDLVDDVGFLIRYHLTMEQVAFRRNLNDPQTIIDFSGIFRHRHLLELLYVLTYADLSAVNKNVWTDWKEMLLSDLYRKTREALDGKYSAEQLRRRATQRISMEAEVLLSRLSRTIPDVQLQVHRSLLEDASYGSAFDFEEILEHLRWVQRLETVATFFSHRTDFTEVTVIAHDAPYALSRFCGVLSANDANILDAHIFTREDGIIIDKFRVVDFISRSVLTEERCRKIRSDLDEVMRGVIDIVHLLERHRMKWKRRSRHANPNIRVGVDFEDHPKFTIIDVFAPDTLGFLYKITESMSNLGLNISFAKIATRTDGIVDAFYVLDEQGNRLEETSRRERVRQEILRTIATLSTSELVLNPTNALQTG